MHEQSPVLKMVRLHVSKKRYKHKAMIGTNTDKKNGLYQASKKLKPGEEIRYIRGH